MFCVVIEDDDNIREAITDLLEGEGYRVQGFRNGKEALSGLRASRTPCLILLDLMMPEMDGWSFLRMRQGLGDVIASIPVVVVSAVGSRHELARHSTNGFLRKPIDVDELLEVVRTHCRLRLLLREGESLDVA